MKCPKNKDNDKLYIIPTKKWLKPLEKLIVDDINTSGLIMIAENIEKEKVIVKITKDKRDDIIEINDIIKHMPNFIETYCTFSCLENFDILDAQYKDAKGFCNSKDGSGDFITLEIMKKYKNGSLNKYINKLELDQVINIIKQLLLAQIHIFNKTGFIHNDMSNLGNILIDKTKKPIDIKYKFNIDDFTKKKITITTDFIPTISDFNESIIYKNELLTIEKYMDQLTLGGNLYTTFNTCLLLLKDKSLRDSIKDKMNINQTEINKYIGFSIKNLRGLYKKNYMYEGYIKKESYNMFNFTNKLIMLLDNHATDEWFDL